MKKILFVPLFFSSLSAVLPPLYETIKEYQAILEAPELSQKLEAGEPIMSLSKSSDTYIITTNKHFLNVDIIYNPQAMPGPASFHLLFGEVRPLAN